MNKGVVWVVMLTPAAGMELSSTAAVVSTLRNLRLRHEAPAAHFATTDPNSLIYRSTAAAKGTSYCCGPVFQEVGVCGGAHGRGCLLSKAQICGVSTSCCGAR